MFSGGFTRIEMLVVAAVVAMLVAVSVPLLSRNKVRNQRINCVSNLKQVGVGFRLFGNDCDNRYPNFTNLIGNGYAWTNFAAAGNEITSPRALLCPADMGKLTMPDGRKRLSSSLATDFSTGASGFAHPSHQENDLSYFYGTSADETKPNTLLAGDRNLSANMAAYPNGPDQVPGWSYAGKGEVLLGGDKTGVPKPNCGWNSAIHRFMGNVLLGDGSVSQLTTSNLVQQLSKSDDAENHVIFPGPIGGP